MGFRSFHLKIVRLIKSSFSLVALIGLTTACNSDRVGFKTVSSISGVPEILIEKDAHYINSQKVQLNISSAGYQEMYVTNDPTCLEGGEWEPSSDLKEEWSLAQENSETQVFVQFRTVETEEVSGCSSDSIIHDDIPPVVKFPVSPLGVSNKTSAEMSFEIEESGSGVKTILCRPEADEYSACESPFLMQDLSEDTHKFAVKVTDKAGNISEVLSHEWRVDKSVPTVQLTKTPKDPNNKKKVTLEFEGSDGEDGEITEFLCRQEGQIYSTCESPMQITGLADGGHRFAVIAKDSAGNTSIPAQHSWTTDTVKPTVMINEMPTDPTNETIAEFYFTGNDDVAGVEKFQCALDSNAFADCASPAQYMNLTDGQHQFRVVAIDKAGNVSNQATFTWMIDTVAPNLVWTAVPSDPSDSEEATFGFTATDSGSGVAGYECSLDSGAYAACSSPVALAGLSAGTHSFDVVAIDNVGNRTSPLSFSWMINLQDCYDQQVIQPNAEETKKVDILFAIDTSSSFDQEKQDVIDELESMIANFPADTDYRLAVVLGHGDQSNYSGVLYRRNGSDPAVIDSQTMSLSQIQNALQGKMVNAASDTNTDGGEAVIYSLSKLLQPAAVTTARNQGFFRDDAALAVIVMSDENDICARVPNGVSLPRDGQNNEGPAFDDYCVNPEVSEQTVYAQLSELQGTNPLLIAGLVYTNENTVPSGGENSLGYGFFDIVALNDGILIDLASGSFAAGLADIGNLTTERLNLITRIPLGQPNVDQSSIMVSIDNQPSSDFSYSAVTNEINLGYAGQAGSVVDVYYCVQ